MAFAIASACKPEQGIFTAIIAGFVISALGGSSVQIGGPAGAFIVIVYGIVQRYGLTNLMSPRRWPACCCSSWARCGSVHWFDTCPWPSSSASPTASPC
jgi:MFS superfamily sulfate permease-like transporter